MPDWLPLVSRFDFVFLFVKVIPLFVRTSSSVLVFLKVWIRSGATRGAKFGGEVGAKNEEAETETVSSRRNSLVSTPLSQQPLNFQINVMVVDGTLRGVSSSLLPSFLSDTRLFVLCKPDY